MTSPKIVTDTPERRGSPGAPPAQKQASSALLPPDHELRVKLNNEVHARPPVALDRSCRILYLATWTGANERDAQWDHLAELCAAFDVALPERSTHFSSEIGDMTVQWEQHSEFTRFMIVVDDALEDEARAGSEDPISKFDDLPDGWLAKTPGQVLLATHVAFLQDQSDDQRHTAFASAFFERKGVVGSAIGGSSATAFTDFKIHDDGFGRLLVINRSMAPRQAGRAVQALLEIDSYRMMALLAMPVAQKLWPVLAEAEAELKAVTAEMTDNTPDEEKELLHRLTELEAGIEREIAENQYRFNASAAYYELVQGRIDGLRETRLANLQTFQEFVDRRLAPAMKTCQTSMSRLESLTRRVGRAAQLLSTRVDVARQDQNQRLLHAIGRRAKMQLKLQRTVEGLSVAAITYYIVGLVLYAFTALEDLGLPINAKVVAGLSIPLVIFAVWYGVGRIKKTFGIDRLDGEDD